MKVGFLLFCLAAVNLLAVDFTGPGEWKVVNTNAIAKWQAENLKRAGDDCLVLNGVVGDKAKREVRFLAEAVGHSAGTTTEFLLVGPASDRAYESAAVTVASPADIVRAVEFTGVKRGNCVDGSLFHFVPCGERFRLFVRRLDSDGSAEQLFSQLLKESVPDDPLLSGRGFVFAGGAWQEKDGEAVCITAAVPPCAVVSLYNEFSIFDIPQQAGQSAVYGRLTMKDDLPYGALLEVIARPVSKEPLVTHYRVTARAEGEEIRLRTENKEKNLSRDDSIKDAMLWLRSQSETDIDLYLNLGFDTEMTVRQAHDVAAVFEILAAGGLTLYGKAPEGVYYKAFLPQDAWRKREGRVPQPFELHLSRGQDGELRKKLVFIEEDWSGAGLDPRLTPKEFPFTDWNELEPLVISAGGKDNRVVVLFVFVPGDMQLKEFMPGVNALSKRLPLVHIFAD